MKLMTKTLNDKKEIINNGRGEKGSTCVRCNRTCEDNRGGRREEETLQPFEVRTVLLIVLNELSS